MTTKKVVFFFTLDNEEGSKQWLTNDATQPLKAKTAPRTNASKDHDDCTEFWDEDLPDSLTQLRFLLSSSGRCPHHLRQNRHGKSKSILLHQDYAGPHTTRKAIAKIDELRWKLILHPPCSIDHEHFLTWKSFLRDRRFNT